MKAFRIGLHSFALLVADLGGIGLGALAAYRLLGSANQVWLQIPIAVALSDGLFFAWTRGLRVGGACRFMAA